MSDDKMRRGSTHFTRGWSLSARLAYMTNRAGPDDCWEWLGYRNEDGYGTIADGGKMRKAHRCAWEEENGPVPAGLEVLHSCDNPGCVNPVHLSADTHAANIKDSYRKGRTKVPGFKGERVWNARLTTEKVVAIRADARTHQAIADDYGVSRPHISYIKSRRFWSHV